MPRPMHSPSAPIQVRLRDVAISLGVDSRTSMIVEGADRIATLEAALREIDASATTTLERGESAYPNGLFAVAKIASKALDVKSQGTVDDA